MSGFPTEDTEGKQYLDGVSELVHTNSIAEELAEMTPEERVEAERELMQENHFLEVEERRRMERERMEAFDSEEEFYKHMEGR